MNACQDEIRDADRLIPLSRSSRIVEDDLISIEILPIGIIAHLAPCHLIRRQTAAAIVASRFLMRTVSISI